MAQASAPPVAAVAAGVSSMEVDPDELKRRTEFLKGQRDKLLELKRAEREKQLAEAEKQAMKSRPKSARAARSALKKSPSANVDPDTLNARRALAEKLKNEVIAQSDLK